MKVRFGDEAERDIEWLLDRIAETDPNRARLTNRTLRAVARSIGAAPMLGPAVGARGMRKKTLPPFCLLYAILGPEILILRIVHERSDWASLI